MTNCNNKQKINSKLIKDNSYGPKKLKRLTLLLNASKCTVYTLTLRQLINHRSRVKIFRT